MILARSPTASSTALSSAIFSSSVVVGDSPVVPDSTRPSQPASTRWVARRAAVAVSSEPSGLNGVAIAVSTVPRRACTSNPLVLTNTKITRWRSSLRGQRGGGDLGAVRQRRDLEVGEGLRCDRDELAQARDGQPADFQVGLFAGPHGDEVPPRPVVAGDDDAGLCGVRQDRAGGLTGLFATDPGVGLIGELGLQPGQQFGVGRAAGVSGGGEQVLQFRVVLHAGRQNNL